MNTNDSTLMNTSASNKPTCNESIKYYEKCAAALNQLVRYADINRDVLPLKDAATFTDGLLRNIQDQANALAVYQKIFSAFQGKLDKLTAEK